MEKIKETQDLVAEQREIVAVPSMDGQLKDVGEPIIAEMNKLGFDEARFDRMGHLARLDASSARQYRFTRLLDQICSNPPTGFALDMSWRRMD
jgi:hypothetical protein